MAIKSLREFITNGLAEDSSQLQRQLLDLVNYVESVGDVQAVMEMAQINIEDGDGRISNNPLYLQCYDLLEKSSAIEVYAQPVDN